MRICDFLFVLRPVILIPAWSFFLLGVSAASNTPLGPRWTLPPMVPFACLTAILITAYLLNQVFDRESDEKNDKCPFLTRGVFKTRTVVLMAVVFFLAASHLFHRTDPEVRVALFLALLLSLLYSVPPVRLCARPFLDLLANAIGYGGVAFVIGYNTSDASISRGAWIATPYMFLVASTFLHTTVLDVEGDRAANKISTTVLIGVNRSVILAAVLHVLAVAAAILTASPTAVAITAVSLPVTAVAAIKPSTRMSSFVIQANTLIVTLAAVATRPLYLTLVFPLIWLSRYYHSRRFGIMYPGPGSSRDRETPV
ncbi:MAG: UbiA family prenyltransferase [Candidatus Latescibacterota bacterium]|nr:MAG: UbiA family prenyltransferase [Candidatus Latescibacterota bacterium]